MKEKYDTTNPTRRCFHAGSASPMGESTQMGPQENSRQCFLHQMSRFCNNHSRKGRNERQRPAPARKMSALWE